MSSDLFNELQDKVKLLDTALGMLGKRGKEHAHSEQDYRIALASKMLIEREKGTPVTIINDLCRGDKDIALMKFKRDCAEVNYKANLEAINIYKLQVKILDEQISREWNRK